MGPFGCNTIVWSFNWNMPSTHVIFKIISLEEKCSWSGLHNMRSDRYAWPNEYKTLKCTSPCIYRIKGCYFHINLLTFNCPSLKITFHAYNFFPSITISNIAVAKHKEFEITPLPDYYDFLAVSPILYPVLTTYCYTCRFNGWHCITNVFGIKITCHARLPAITLQDSVHTCISMNS